MNSALPAMSQSGATGSLSRPAPAPLVIERRPAGGPALLPPILTSQPSLAGLASAFRRRWRLAITLGLFVGAVAAGVAWFLTPDTSYTASAQLRVDSNLPRIMFDTAERRSDFMTYQRWQMSAVKSRMVLNVALRDAKVAKLDIVRQHQDPIDWLTKELQVDFALSPEILRISMTGKDPDALLAVIRAVREAYLSEEVQKQNRQRTERLAVLKRIVDRFETTLQSKRAALRKAADPLGTRDNKVLSLRQEHALKELSYVQMELLSLQSQLRKARLELLAKGGKDKGVLGQSAMAAATAAATAATAADVCSAAVATAATGEFLNTPDDLVVPEATLEEIVRKDPGVLGFQKEIERLDQVLADYRRTSGDLSKEPGFVRAQKELESTRKALAERRKELIPQIERELRDRGRLNLKRDQAHQQERVDEMERLEQMLADQIEDGKKRIHTVGQTGQILEDLQDEIKNASEIAQKVGLEKEALEIEIQAPQRVTPIDEPYATKHDGLALKVALVAGLAGFGLVLFGVSLLEFRARRLVSVGQVTHGLSLPVVGTMPRVPTRSGRDLPQSGDPSHMASHRLLIESVDAARAVIVHASRRMGLRVVMITSAVGGEGKTMLSAHLAASMARAGWRALLVDADFRRPSLDKIFGLADQPGLSDVLRGTADIADVRQPGPMEGLWVIPAGQCDARSMQALAQGALRGLFERIKGDYDLIVVDSAPVLPVVDSQIIAQAVDGVILSALRDVSRLPQIHAACERLMLFQVSLLGAVVHGEEARTYGSPYPYTPVPAAAPETPTDSEETP
jgi:capsular exopolysaccharide synthesis family protein